MTKRADDSATVVAAVCAGYTIGVLGGTLQPLLVGALIDDLHFEAIDAGLLGSIELAAAALAAFVLAPRMGTLSRRVACLAGGVLAVCGNGGSAIAGTFAALAACRFVAGIGAGTVLSISNGAVAGCRRPERVFALSTIAGTIALTALFALLPPVIARFAYRGAYGSMALVALALLPLLGWVPDVAVRDLDQKPATMAHAALGVATLLATALLFFGQSAVWTFAERLALNAHLSHELTGMVLAASTLAGLGGAALASRIGSAGGRTRPLVAGVVTNGASMLALAYAGSPLTYSAVIVVNGIAYLFMVPCLLAVAAALDAQGRWAAAGIGAATIGTALGPGIAGPIVAGAGYGALGWLAFAASVLAAAALTPVARSLDRRGAETGLDA